MNNQNENNLSSLLKAQKSIMEQMDKFIANTKKTALAKRTRGYYLGRVNGWHDLWQKFLINEQSISMIKTEKDIQDEYFVDNSFSTYEQLFYEFKGELVDTLEKIEKDCLATKPQTQSDPQSKIDKSTQPNQIQLPIITLPKFSGNYNDWVSFRDLFLSVIDANQGLANVQKLHYLKSNLLGEAAKVVSQFHVTNDNYKAAWEALSSRYENKRVLITAQLKTLTSQPKITAESAISLKSLLDVTSECMSSLTNLKVTTLHWDPLLIHLLLQKLPIETHKTWEESLADTTDYPTWSTFKKFLEVRFRALEAIGEIKLKENSHIFHQNRKSRDRAEQTFQSFYTSDSICKLCKGNHSLRSCESFLKRDPKDRLRFVKTKGFCINCLGQYHSFNKCLSSGRCAECGQKHHTLLHLTMQKKKHEQGKIRDCTKTDVPSSSSSEKTSKVITHFIAEKQGILLATALIKIKSKSGLLTARALIDPGSQATFITSDILHRLNVPAKPTTVKITGLGLNETARATQRANITILSDKTSLIANETSLQVSAIVLDTLTDLLPSTKTIGCVWQHLKQLELADPTFNAPGKIDVIIGADIYPLILLDGIMKGSGGAPLAQKTIFGWILTGKVTQVENETVKLQSFNNICSLEDELKKFWEIEEVAQSTQSSPEDELCEQIYRSTHYRKPDGSYVVRLPFKDNTPRTLGSSRQAAMKRFLVTEKAIRQKMIADEYNQVLQEYCTSGHMVENHSLDKRNSPKLEGDIHSKIASYYLPHHAVIKPSSKTTKLRVVFDASCKSSNGASLNDILLVGPALQEDITSIIMRWRHHKFVITADIEKMYRQIWIHPEDSNYQRILWRQDRNHPIRDYRLLTVTFGACCAPFLAIRTLHQLAEDEKNRYPAASQCLIKDFYVDDVLTGRDSIEELRSLQAELISLLKSGRFPLRKFSSNSAEILKDIPEENKSAESLQMQFTEKSVVKALGIYWDPKADTFDFKLNINLQGPWTKRTVLSSIAKLFDPLGWISPIIVYAKIFMQKLWLAGMNWDENIPEHLVVEWTKFINNFEMIEKINIPRWLGTTSNSKLELHGFCDSSEKAYAAAVYIRVINSNHEITTYLVISKTRVASVKSISLPRLELCGAVLLSKLIKTLKETIKLEYKIYLWTDSTVVLSWIKSLPNRWKSFVANRITQIIDNTGTALWRHVPSHENPADLASRGTLPLNLIANPLWWEGPTWLRYSEDKWPIMKLSLISNACTEEQKKVRSFIVSANTEELIERFSNLKRACRVLAYCKRFITSCREPKSRKQYEKLLSPQEIHEAKIILIKESQRFTYQKEIDDLRIKGTLSRKSSLLSLNPFLDSQKVLRVGGRLEYANLSFEEKHPIILSPSSKITTLVIEDTHRDTLHGGLSLTLYTLRKNYWIPRGKQVVKKQIHQCIICFRWKTQYATTIMGNLPTGRVNPARPFTDTGIDFAGPIQIKLNKTRNAKSMKGYIAMFVCFATKAIHIEVVSDLSAESFLAAAKRFFARRGLSKNVYTDNATNFVGASKAIQKEMQAIVKRNSQLAAEFFANRNINWHFIPAAAPHFGGLWEASVKSMKYHLRRIVGQTLLTFEELSTLVTQIEAALNSRPLCPLTSDPNDLNPLTPGHFLTGDSLLSMPEQDYQETKVSYLSRWQLLQKMQQDFWRRWSAEYLHHLQQRPKWKITHKEIEIGDLVLLKEDGLPPSCWKLARVVEKHPGKDNITRVITVKTQHSRFKRPISKICPLPFSKEGSTQ